MDTIYKELALAIASGERAVLAIIISRNGSAPRSVGASMLLTEDGVFHGTVGGGRVEQEAQTLARETLNTGRSFVREFGVGQDSADNPELQSGTVQILFATLNGQSAWHSVAVDCLHGSGEATEEAWLLMTLEPTGGLYFSRLTRAGVQAGSRLFQNQYSGPLLPLLQEKPALYRKGKFLCFTLPLAVAGQVYLFGGGHVAQKLAPLLTGLDFRYTLIDDREHFASREVFPGAARILLSGYEDICARLPITQRDFLVLMTKDQSSDYRVLAGALRTPARYIGMIGSHKKIQFVFGRLQAQNGFSAEELRRVHAPIGLPLGGETPAEVALSIAAEMVQVRSAQAAT